MRDHLIVCGLGPLAMRLVAVLRQAGMAVVSVEEAPRPVDRQFLELAGVPLVVGPPWLTPVLVRAGAGRARGVICAADGDLRNLETALAVHHSWPGLRVVAGIANASVGRALAEVTGPGSVVDVAGLAAPSLVQACLSDSHTFVHLEGVVFESTSVTVDTAGTLRERFGDLVPIAVSRPGDASLEVCPGRDTAVAAGDTVWALGTPSDLHAHGIGRQRSRHAGEDGRAPSWPSRAAAVAAGIWAQTDRPLRATAAALVALVVTATVVLRLGYTQPGTRAHLPVLSAVYFTVETIATVGYGDFSFAHQATWLEVAGIGFIVLGVSLLTTMFALITNALVGRSLASALGRQRVTRMRGHVVVVGLGRVGIRVVEGLRAAGVGVVAVELDDDNRHLASLRGLGVPVINGDASEPATLDAVNIAGASAVAILTSDDLTNLDAGLAARQHLGDAAGEVPVVMRIFDRSLSDMIAANFGFRQVLSTSALAAPWFVGASLGLDIVSTFYVERDLFLVARLTVAAGGGLAGVAMQDIGARIRVIAIRRAGVVELEYPPRRATRFGAGDQAYLIGPPGELLAVLRRNASA